MFLCYSKEIGVGVLLTKGLHLQLFKFSLTCALCFFLFFVFLGVFCFCFLVLMVFVCLFVCFGNSHIGHKNQNMDSEFKNPLWVCYSRHNQFLTHSPPQFRSGLHASRNLGLWQINTSLLTVGV